MLLVYGAAVLLMSASISADDAVLANKPEDCSTDRRSAQLLKSQLAIVKTERKNLHQSYSQLKEHIAQRDSSCQIETANLEGSIKSKSIALNKIIALEEKDRTNEAIIANLRGTVLKHSTVEKKRIAAQQSSAAATAKPANDHSGLKVYVYDMPRFNEDFYNAHLSEYGKKCRNQIGEREMHTRFLNSSNRVTDGEQADLYYVPVYTGCYRSVVGTELQTDAYSATYKFITDAVELIKKNYPFWERSQGRDHVWLFLYDYGVCLEYARPNARRRRIPSGLENSILVQYLGDLTPGMECFNTWKDVVIPAFINNPEVLAVRGGENIDPKTRNIFAYFRGSIKWKLSKFHTKEMNYSNGVREIINNTYHNDPRFSLHQGSSPDYIKEMTSSVFCLAPLGYAVWNFRLYESIICGCIPVILADNVELPFEKDLDYRSFSVKVLETQAHLLGNILASIPKETIREKQQALKLVWKKFSYQSPTEEGDAFSGLLDQLAAHAKRPYQPAAKSYWL